MTEDENSPQQRSIEHLIPNKMLRFPRSARDGDFYACRKCNIRKSHIDYVLSVVCKTQSTDPQYAADALADAVTKEDRRANRFITMLRGATEESDGVHFDIPISVDELLEYMIFLAKGQYFMATGFVFQDETQVLILDFINKPVLDAVEHSYRVQHSVSPFRDLEKNKYSRVLSQGDCIVYSKNLNFLFMFYDYTAIIASIKKRNRKNEAREASKRQYILDNFPRPRGAA